MSDALSRRWAATLRAGNASLDAVRAANEERDRYRAGLQEIVDYYLNHAGWEHASWEAERAMEALHPDA